MKRLYAAAIVSALLGLLSVLTLVSSVSAAEARTWTSQDGKFTREATLVGFENGQVQLRKDDGSVTRVPLEALCAKDRAFVEAKYPQSEQKPPQPGPGEREWKSRDGKSTTVARLLDYKDGKVRLQKANGKEIVVPADALSSKDRRWLQEELRRRRKAERDAERDAGRKAEPGAEQGPDQQAEVEDEARAEQQANDEGEVAGKIGSQTVEMKLVPLEVPTGRRRMRPNATAAYMLMMTNPQQFLIPIGLGHVSPRDDFRQIAQKEPEYAAPMPFRAVARIDSGDYAFALDAIGKEPACYNRLYFDANANGDLTDEEPIDAANVSGGGPDGISQASFPRIDLGSDGDGGKLNHAFVMMVSCQRSATASLASALLYAGAYREGEILQGRKKIRLVLVDRNSNGRFDDRVAIRKNGSSFSITDGDLLLINPNTKNLLAADATMGRDRHFVSKTICIGKEFYKLEVSPTGDRLKLKPTELAMGYVTHDGPAYRAVVYSNDYGVLMIGGSRGQKIPLPEGQWKLASYTIDASGYTGGARTAVTATFPNDGEAVAVSRNKTSELSFGAPFRPVVTAQRSGTKGVNLSLAIVGAGGERCTSFYVKGKRPPEPGFQVRNKDGDVIHQGKFEYG